MTRLIKKLMNVPVFNRHADILVDIETGTHSDMDEWKGWDAWVDIEK